MTSNNFQCVALPLITTGITIFARIISRPDKLGAVDRSVFNVGINLCVTAIFILVTKSIILPKAIIDSIIELRIGLDTMLVVALLKNTNGLDAKIKDYVCEITPFIECLVADYTENKE